MNRSWKKIAVIVAAVLAALFAAWMYGQSSEKNIPKPPKAEAEQADTRTSKDILEENNARSERELQRVRDSIKEGDSMEEDGYGHYKVKRANGSEEHYEQVSGIAGFATIRTK
jgi:hypothetical protein